MNISFSSDHIAALNRQRRIIFQDDVLANEVFRTEEISAERMTRIVNFYMSRLDEQPNQIDSIWFEWGEGNTAVWPSKVLPCTENVFPKWWEAGIDPVEVLLNEARRRNREVFFSYRINGSDNDALFDPPHRFEDPIPLKTEHPQCLIQAWHSYWNFACTEVRELKLNVVREVAEMYDFDGIQIDFARIPVMFPAGQQWLHRDLLTEFMCQIREALLDIERHRSRPLLLAARVPENLMGCHFDGIDVEAWAQKFLVDIFVIGTRTSSVDIPTYRRITAGTPIKIYPCWDDHHSSHGYREANLEVWRGVYANWWHHCPDGVHTFNLMVSSPETARALDLEPSPRWEVQRSIFREIGSPKTLLGKDKLFFIELRGGGHAEAVVPHPQNWHTPRHMYFQTNMLAPLPAQLVGDGRGDVLLILPVADDVNAVEADESVLLELQVVISTVAVAVSADHIEVRINNILLGAGRLETLNDETYDSIKHCLLFDVPLPCIAVGDNLVGVRLSKPIYGKSLVQVNRFELHIQYTSNK